MIKGLVIAGNKEEFNTWIKKNKFKKKDYMYATEYYWAGLHMVPVIKIGTWYERRDIDADRIEHTINCCEDNKCK